jgi:hypothetical protein
VSRRAVCLCVLALLVWALSVASCWRASAAAPPASNVWLCVRARNLGDAGYSFDFRQDNWWVMHVHTERPLGALKAGKKYRIVFEEVKE